MSKKIPLFPLSLVAFPGEELNLHIFEKRYRQLVKDCMANELSFGIVPVLDKKLSDIGTEMEILEISHIYGDGKMDIRTKAGKAFHLLEFQEKIEDKLYPGGEVELLSDIDDSNLLLLGKVFDHIKKLYKSMKMPISLPVADYGYRIYSIAHKIGLNTSQEIELLRTRSEVERLEYVLDHLKSLILIVGQMEEMRNKVKMNGHFKDALPPDFEL